MLLLPNNDYMTSLRNEKTFETGLLLSQCLSKAYKTYIIPIFLKLCKNLRSSFTALADAADKEKLCGICSTLDQRGIFAMVLK